MKLKGFRSRGRNANVFEDDELLEEEFNQGELAEEETEVIEAPAPLRERREVTRKPKKGRSWLFILVGIVAVGILLFVAFPPKYKSPPLLPAGVAQTAEEEQAITQKYASVLAGVRKCPNSTLQEPCFGDLTWEEVLATGVPEKDAVLLGGVFEVTAESPENYSVEIHVPSCPGNCSAGTAWVPAPAGFMFGQPIIAEAEVVPKTTPTPEIPQPKPQPTGGIISPKLKFWGVVILCIAVIVFAFVRYVRSGRNVVTVEQGYVSFVDRLGKYNRILEPGRPHPLIPIFERVRATVDTRVQPREFANLKLTTLDGATVFAGGVVNFQVSDPKKLVYETRLDPERLGEQIRPWLGTGLSGVVLNTNFEELRNLTGSIIEETDARLEPLRRELGELGIRTTGLGFDQIVPTEEIARYLEDRMQAEIVAEALITEAKSQKEAAELRAKGAAALVTEAIAALRAKRVPVTASNVVAILQQLANFQASITGAERVIVTGGGVSPELLTAMAALTEPHRTDATASRVLEMLKQESLHLHVTKEGTIGEE